MMYQSKEATWARLQELWAAFYPVNICEPTVNGNKKLARCAWGSPYTYSTEMNELPLCKHPYQQREVIKCVTSPQMGCAPLDLPFSWHLNEETIVLSCLSTWKQADQYNIISGNQSYHGEHSVSFIEVTNSCKGTFSLYNEQQWATEAEYKV